MSQLLLNIWHTDASTSMALPFDAEFIEGYAASQIPLHYKHVNAALSGAQLG
jgi:hypothetical protein